MALKKVRLEKETSGLPLSSLREIALLQCTTAALAPTRNVAASLTH